MNILLAVCGSISAYKSLDIARSLINKGHTVRVILTHGSLEFVKAQVFRYLGCEEVYLPEDDFTYPKTVSSTRTVLHIELANWANRLIVAPLSANTLAKFHSGQATDLLSCLWLAWDTHKEICLFPAMNSQMYQTQIVKEALGQLQSSPNIFIHPPDSGMLACGDEGVGKLPPIEKVVITSLYANPYLKQSSRIKKRVLITTGATVCPLDPVRYLTNSSSGITGFYFALTALSKHYSVDLIIGHYATEQLNLLEGLPGVSLKRVKTPEDMFFAVKEHIKHSDLYISAAAISDFVFETSTEKIKKSTLPNTLPIKPAPDILQYVLENKNKGMAVVGMAAETSLTDTVLKEKYMRKPVDLLVGTFANNGLLGDDVAAFGQDHAKYKIYKNESLLFEGNLSKEDMAKKVLDQVEFPF